MPGIVLKILGLATVLAGLSHVLLGLAADVMLGANLPAAVVLEPSLDSQNRFFGAVFTLYGVLLWIAADDLSRYRTIVRLVLVWFFAGGLVRLGSLALRGRPSDMIVVLTLLELVVPPLLWWAMRSEERMTAGRQA